MEYSDVDSRRFGLNIYRATLPEIREGELFEQLVSNKVDVAILRFPTSQQHEISRLDRLGVPYIITDVLVYYASDLRALKPSEARNPELTFESAGDQHHQPGNDPGDQDARFRRQAGCRRRRAGGPEHPGGIPQQHRT